MTPKLTDRLARLEAAQAAPTAHAPMPAGLYEVAFRAAAEEFGGYPSGAADTLADGLARALGYADRAAADAGAEADRETFGTRVGGLWPRFKARYGSSQVGPVGTGDSPTFRVWVGLLDGPSHYRSDERPTADLTHLPNGLPLFDYGAASVRAAFASVGTTADEAEAMHDDRQRH